MINLRKASLSLLLMILTLSIHAQGIICIQSDTGVSFETDFGKAVNKAKDGDIIYLPGGSSISSPANVTIKKKVNIIGAGYHPDSTKATGPTVINSGIILDSGSEGSTISGLHFGDLDVRIGGIALTRCLLSYIYMSKGSDSSIYFSENIIIQIRGSEMRGRNCIVANNIIFGSIVSLNNYVIKNNVFLNQSSTPVILAVNSSVFESNIFYQKDSSKYSQGSYNNYSYNNLTVADSTGILSFSSYVSDNITRQNQSSIFKKFNGETTWNKNLDFHLQSSSKGVGAGRDSMDVGIYGSSAPFKDGGMPVNPRFLRIQVNNATDASGKLGVKIKVQGQSR